MLKNVKTKLKGPNRDYQCVPQDVGQENQEAMLSQIFNDSNSIYAENRLSPYGFTSTLTSTCLAVKISL